MKAYAIALVPLLMIAAVPFMKTAYQERAEERLTAQAAALTDSEYEMDISELCSLNQPENAHDCKVVGL